MALLRHIEELGYELHEQFKDRRLHMPRKKAEEIDVDDILDEIEDEELEDADVLDEDDDPTVTEKKPRKGRTPRRKSSAKAKKERSGIGTAELAEAAGTDPRSLRMLLRAEFPKGEGGRYEWSSLNDPEAKAIIKRVKSGGASEARKASLDELKSRSSKKRSSAKSSAKKTTARKKSSARKSSTEMTAAEKKKARAAARRKAKAEDAA